VTETETVSMTTTSLVPKVFSPPLCSC